MNKKPGLIFFSTCFCAAAITACSTSAKEADYEWVGGLFGGNVVYNVHPIVPGKFMLEADTVSSVSKEQLLAAFKSKAARLCRPKKASYQYQVTTSLYMGTVTAALRMPMDAPKITGVVNCK